MVTSLVLGLLIAAGIVIALKTWYHVCFLRNPERDIPSGKVVVSPADGRIMRIEKLAKENSIIRKGKWGKIPVDTKQFSGGTLVSIFMSPLNVHYNRAPLAGTVESVVHRPGKFYNAGDVTKSLQNEHTQITFTTVLGTVMVIQIAGFLARRISCFVKKKQKIDKGERIGLIHMGSQASLLLPKSVTITAHVGDNVEGGSSIIGTY